MMNPQMKYICCNDSNGNCRLQDCLSGKCDHKPVRSLSEWHKAIYGESQKEPNEDISKVFERFAPNIVNREPDIKNADNYRELLPEALWREYPSFMTAYLLDAGRLKVSELAPAEQQLEAIEHQKSRGEWDNLPLIIKLGVFFGLEDKLSLIDTEEKVRQDMQDRSFKAIEKEARELEFKKELRRLDEEAKKEAERILNTPRSEQSFYNEILETRLKEVMKNE